MIEILDTVYLGEGTNAFQLNCDNKISKLYIEPSDRFGNKIENRKYEEGKDFDVLNNNGSNSKIILFKNEIKDSSYYRIITDKVDRDN